MPFELPLPDKVSLRTLFAEQITAIMHDTPEGLFDQERWSDLFWEGIDRFIRTPRDVVRLTNTMLVTYSTVVGEVNPVDFIALETLRVFVPLVYDVIRRNGDAFSGHAGATRLFGPTADDLKAFHDSWLDTVREEDREAVAHITRALFPRLDASWGGAATGAHDEGAWRRDVRVASTDVFPTYFRLAVPESGVSRAECKAC